MKTTLQLLFFTSCLLFCSNSLFAQIDTETNISVIPLNTEISISKQFVIPAGANAVTLDDGKGKLCSCKFYTPESEETRTYEQNQSKTLKNITIKGLFDGSQMHVARVYFNESNEYYKFKCYSRDIKVKDIAPFIRFGLDTMVKVKEE